MAASKSKAGTCFPELFDGYEPNSGYSEQFVILGLSFEAHFVFHYHFLSQLSSLLMKHYCLLALNF